MEAQETREELFNGIVEDLIQNDLLDLNTYDTESAQGVTTEIIKKHLGEYIIIKGKEIL